MVVRPCLIQKRSFHLGSREFNVYCVEKWELLVKNYEKKKETILALGPRHITIMYAPYYMRTSYESDEGEEC